jgi:hypothetical protein
VSVTIPLAFHAETEDDARVAAIEWGRAEPNVVSLRVESVRRDPMRPTWWVVTVTVTMLEGAQRSLGL